MSDNTNTISVGSEPGFKLKVSAASKKVFIFSALLFVIGLAMFFVNGFNLGVDFESGISEELRINSEDVKIDNVRKSLDSLDVRVQRSGDEADKTFIIRAAATDEEARLEKQTAIFSALNTFFGEGNVESISSSFIGAKFSSTLITTSLTAIAVALVGILIYIWLRFQLSFSVASVITLVHDVLLLLAFIVVAKVEISSITIAAILTIIGYSLNNTIVIFDRIKENIKLGEVKRLDSICDKSINQSLRRTIFSSLTTLAVIIPIGLIVTNHDIKMFSLVLSVGIIIGIYSSSFIAANFLRLLSFSGSKALDPMQIANK